MVTFYQFVRDALLTLQGVNPLPVQPLLKAVCTSPIKKAPGRTEFQRGVLYAEDGVWKVRVTGEQGSGILKSMSDANCFIMLHDHVGRRRRRRHGRRADSRRGDLTMEPVSAANSSKSALPHAIQGALRRCRMLAMPRGIAVLRSRLHRNGVLAQSFRDSHFRRYLPLMERRKFIAIGVKLARLPMQPAQGGSSARGRAQAQITTPCRATGPLRVDPLLRTREPRSAAAADGCRRKNSSARSGMPNHAIRCFIRGTGDSTGGFLLKLDTTVAAKATRDTEGYQGRGRQRYGLGGGCGANQGDIVAYLGHLCPQDGLPDQAGELSSAFAPMRAWAAPPASRGQGHHLLCRQKRLRPLSKACAQVLSGPAPQPLAAILLEHDARRPTSCSPSAHSAWREVRRSSFSQVRLQAGARRRQQGAQGSRQPAPPSPTRIWRRSQAQTAQC